MADAEDKLGRFRAAMHAFLLSTEECRRKYEELEAEIEAAADPLAEMTPEEFARFREEVRVQLEKATEGRQDPLSDAELDDMIGSTFKRLVPKVLYFVGECTSRGVEHTFRGDKPPDSRTIYPSVGRKRCQRCDQPATFHITEITGGEWIAFDLCERHAIEHLTGEGPT